MKKQLQELGLTKNESLLYEALLKNGPLKAGKISQKTGIHRRTIYDTIETLIQKGLISYIKQNNTKVYQAQSPKKFQNLLEQKQETIKEILPSLLSLYSQEHDSPETTFHKGKNAIKTVLENQLAQKQEIFVLGASETAYEVLQFYFKWYDKKRVKNKIKTKIIFNKTKSEIKIPLANIRYLPEKYSSSLAINICENLVSIILWRKENPIAIVIKEPEIAKAYKKHFEIMWKIARPHKKAKNP